MRNRFNVQFFDVMNISILFRGFRNRVQEATHYLATYVISNSMNEEDYFVEFTLNNYLIIQRVTHTNLIEIHTSFAAI